jgi:hypothetical protein
MTPTTLDAPAAAVRVNCPACGIPRIGAYCPQCGQRFREGRLTLGRILADILASVGDLDRGLPGTALSLCRSPRAVIGSYIAGPTGRYTGPAKYLAVCAAIGAVVYLQLGWLSAGDERAETFSSIAHEHLSLMLVAQVPVATVLSWLLFRGAGLNLAEHLVFNAYATAQLLLILSVTAPAALLGGIAMELYAVLLIASAVAYYCWAAVDFFRQHALADLARAGTVQATVLLLYVLVLGFGTGAL